MKKPPQVALVCAGAVNRGALSRLHTLRDRIAWVKASTSSAASRAANALGRGMPVRSWSDMAAAEVVAVCVPDKLVPAAIAELGSSGLSWKGKTLVLLDSVFDSGALAEMERRGALVASIDCLRSAGGCPVVEGSTEALRRLRKLCHLKTHRAVELRRGAKADYLRALSSANHRFIPLVSELVDGLVTAGMTKAAADAAAASLFGSSMQAWTRAGRRLLRQ